MFCYSIEPFKLGISTDFLCAELPGVVQSSVLCVCVWYILPHLFWLCTHRKQRAKREREREIDRQREKTDVNLTSDLVWQECHTQRRRSRPTASNGVVAYICGFFVVVEAPWLGSPKMRIHYAVSQSLYCMRRQLDSDELYGETSTTTILYTFILYTV